MRRIIVTAFVGLDGRMQARAVGPGTPGGFTHGGWTVAHEGGFEACSRAGSYGMGLRQLSRHSDSATMRLNKMETRPTRVDAIVARDRDNARLPERVNR